MRCAAHGLATGPDGRCVVCRRESQGSTRAAPLSVAPGASAAGRATSDARTAAVPIDDLAPRSVARRGLAVIVGLCWLVASAAAAVWVWQYGDAPLSLSAAFSGDRSGAGMSSMAVAPRGKPGSPTASDIDERPLTEAEAMRQVELAADRALRTEVQAQRERQAALGAARERTAAANAARDAERRAVLAADMQAQAQGAARRGVRIVMYSTSWCGACKAARAYFHEHAVAYEERDIEVRKDWQQECRVLNPQLSVPTLRIDDQLMVGFGAEAFEEHLARAVARRAGTR